MINLNKLQSFVGQKSNLEKQDFRFFCKESRKEEKNQIPTNKQASNLFFFYPLGKKSRPTMLSRTELFPLL